MKAQNIENKETKYVAYYRVSTKLQGASGLGLESQKSKVENYIKPQSIFASFTDIESGKNDQRPELQKAMQLCKKIDAVLIIAKLDRLSRNLTFISSLMDSKIKFEAVDLPAANNFTIHIFAALAQQEREMISERTKVALQAKKEQGAKLGKPENLTESAKIKGRLQHTENSKANQNNKQAFELIRMYKGTGLNWLQIANKLNENGFKTAKNGTFQAVQVQRIFSKYSNE